MESVTPPLVPADADLRNFNEVRVDIVRLLGSEFHALTNGDEWRAGFVLWMKSFHQVPAGSLPASDRALAQLAEYGRHLDGWLAVKEMALHGWREGSDGRLYHRVVAEKVIEAWIDKLNFRLRALLGAKGKWGEASEPEEDDVRRLLDTAKEYLARLNPQSGKLKAVRGRKNPNSATLSSAASDASSMPQAMLPSDPIGSVDITPTVTNEPILQVVGGTDPRVAPAGFGEWWEAYPRKVGKRSAERAYERALRMVGPDELIAGARRYAAEQEHEPPQFTKHPDRWLNAGCWSDEPAPPRHGTGPPNGTLPFGNSSNRGFDVPKTKTASDAIREQIRLEREHRASVVVPLLGRA